MLKFLCSVALIAFGVVLLTNQESRSAIWRFIRCYWKSIAVFAALAGSLSLYMQFNTL